MSNAHRRRVTSTSYVVGAMGISGMGGVEHETLHTGEV